MNQKIPTQQDVIRVFDVSAVCDMPAPVLRLKLVEQGFDLIDAAKAIDNAISTGALIRMENSGLRIK